MTQNQVKISLDSLVRQVAERRSSLACTGLWEAPAAMCLTRIQAELNCPVVVVAPDLKSARALRDDLALFGNPAATDHIFFPPYNLLPFKFLSYHRETAAARIGCLYRMLAGERPTIMVTTVDAVMQRLIPKATLRDQAELVMVGEDIDLDALVENLIAGGYVRTALVEETGDFAVRGGIVDVFSPLYDRPLRIELFGESVDTLRFFDPVSQRTLASVAEAILLPASEAVLDPEKIGRVLNRVRVRAAELELPVTRVREIVERIKNEGVFAGLESMLSFFYPSLDTLFDYASEQTLFVLFEPAEIEKRVQATEESALRNYETARTEGRLCTPPETLQFGWPRLLERLSERKPVLIKALPLMGPVETALACRLQLDFDLQDLGVLKTALSLPPDPHQPYRPLIDWLRDNLDQRLTSVIVCRSRVQAERLRSVVKHYDIQLKIVAAFPPTGPETAAVWAVVGGISDGFSWPAESVAVAGEADIFDQKKRARPRRAPSAAKTLLSFEDLQAGDLVVHQEHGIGRYEALVKLRIEGMVNDFILITYRGGDKLYLPVDRMGMIEKYLGVDGVAAVLDKMGGKSWERVKARVKRSAEKIAGELLKLYAARQVEQGSVQSITQGEMREFETQFGHDETPDQQRAINDVLSDMARSKPMDRLICGDVGYGKTEVALRAAWVAVNNEKQVAVLVPTTVLAEQHFATFANRFKRTPFNVACLSRFRPQRHQREIIARLKNGQIDIVIGTHRLLSKDVGFQGLGLIVLDEEQRFGVKHKERLKKLRTSVDVLAMTATPLPRTLHMSLSGIRDISVISTPPEMRQAIVSFVCEYDDGIARDAIRKELQRGGQVFFVHNRINSIERMATRLHQLVPEARIDTVHGRMPEETLERVMLNFVSRKIDVLVCTTIIESGLDIPSANTMLINHADRFGLAQMYQLRGRVGRSEEQAYAYLFIPRESELTKDAQKRLKVLMEHSDLGSGFQIAMNDLKIRGGGTILGASQSGHIAAVGYDMFLKLMETAVLEIKGEPHIEPLEPEINLPLSAFIPEDYMSDIDQRLAAYRRLSKMTAAGEISDFKKEMIDRFGPLPTEFTHLLLKIMYRILSIGAAVNRLDVTERQVTLHFSETHLTNPAALVKLVAQQADRYRLTPDNTLIARLDGGSLNARLAQTKNILKETMRHVNS